MGDLKYAELDLTPPEIISGPSVLATTHDTALIGWETDEACDSDVWYGSEADGYDHQVTDPAWVAQHEVLLTGLEPSMLYHYFVTSTDPAGNQVEGEEPNYFQTDPLPDVEPPSIGPLTFSRVDGHFQLYRMAVPVSDTGGIERVGFYLDEVLVGVDYAGSAHSGSEQSAAGTAEVGWLDHTGFTGGTFNMRPTSIPTGWACRARISSPSTTCGQWPTTDPA